MAKKAFVQNKGNTAICYYRYSSDAQRDCSIEQQKQAAHEYAKQNQYKIIREYTDRAVSGTRDDRAEYQLMLHEIKQLRPSVLILWKTDRLARDKYESAIAKRIIRESGCKIEYVAEVLPDDEGAACIIEAIYDAMAENYVIQLRQNVKRGMKYNAERCLYNGRKLLGYTGKVNEKYKIDNDTAIIVKKIFTQYADGVPMQKIVDGLNASGIKSTRGNDFTINSLRHILKNRAYIGEYHYADITIADGMPRIISDELFERVQEKMALNQHGGNKKVTALNPELAETKADFWLTDHLKCGKCGETLHGISGTSKQGKLHYYYTCRGHVHHKCSKKNIRKDVLEDIVSYELENIIREPAMRLLIAHRCYEYYKSQTADNSGYEKVLENNIADIDKKLKNIMAAIENGIFNDTTAERMKNLESQKACLKDELEAIRLRKEHEITESDILRFLESKIGDADSKRMLLDSLIEKIYVYDDKIVINLYFSDDKRELNIDEMNELIKNKKFIMDSVDKAHYEAKYDDSFWSLVDTEKKPDSFH